MSDKNAKTAAADYTAADVSELAQRRRAAGDLHGKAEAKKSPYHATRAIARQLLSASIVVPALLWFSLSFGVHMRLYTPESCAILFVCSVTVVFGVIVWFNVLKLTRIEADRTEAQEQWARAQQQLKHAKETAEAANRFKSMFFANISHEIRTPLTAINGFAELLLNPDRTADQRMADARVIRRNGEHLLTLINDILDLSKIEAGRMSVERILCCPASIVGDVTAMLRPRAAQKGLTLDVKFNGPIPRRVQTDPTRLRQIMINLITNAIKFTKQGGITLSVTIKPSFRATNPVLEVKISDTGIGIPPEQQASLFQPFVQADTTITRQYGGSGLGLAISQHFARALGGDIVMVSEQGKGSSFSVTVATGGLAEAEIHQNPEQAMNVQNDNFAGPRVQISGTVLVAEDGIDNQALIKAKLGETGLKIEIAGNGQIACEKALAAAKLGVPFDLILMDVQMPVMDGFTATMNLRNKGYRGPVIALTANAMERDRSKLLSAGCNDFVTKPIDMPKLFKAIGRYLRVTEVVQVDPTPVPAATEITTAPELAADATKPEPKLTAQPMRPANQAVLVELFYNKLLGEFEQMNQAVEREDRTRLQELARLMLGTAAAAGLKDTAVSVARFLMTIETEKDWGTLKNALSAFATETTPAQNRAA